VSHDTPDGREPIKSSADIGDVSLLVLQNGLEFFERFELLLQLR
jgi:hypothetical protein